MMMDPIHIDVVNWSEAHTLLSQIRDRVFIQEQHVPPELEWDDEDQNAQHVLARHATGGPIGTGRILRNGHIGRMAVLKPYRGQGVGSALLNRLLDVANLNGLQQVYLYAQLSAQAFYEKFQFIAEGEVFMDAGIPHIKMLKKLR